MCRLLPWRPNTKSTGRGKHTLQFPGTQGRLSNGGRSVLTLNWRWELARVYQVDYERKATPCRGTGLWKTKEDWENSM